MSREGREAWGTPLAGETPNPTRHSWTCAVADVVEAAELRATVELEKPPCPNLYDDVRRVGHRCGDLSQTLQPCAGRDKNEDS